MTRSRPKNSLVEELVAEDLAGAAAVDAIEPLVAGGVDLLDTVADQGVEEPLMGVLDDSRILFDPVVVILERCLAIGPRS